MDINTATPACSTQALRSLPLGITGPLDPEVAPGATAALRHCVRKLARRRRHAVVHQLAAGDDLGRVRARSVQGRQEDRKGTSPKKMMGAVGPKGRSSSFNLNDGCTHS